MWNGTLVMISFPGLGEAFGDGEISGVGDSAGVGVVLGVVLTAGVEGLASGELPACGWLKDTLQPAKTRTSPATIAAGTTPLMPGP
jgi:hypothetical protein